MLIIVSAVPRCKTKTNEHKFEHLMRALTAGKKEWDILISDDHVNHITLPHLIAFSSPPTAHLTSLLPSQSFAP